ncbi:hypothetical protein [Xanthobacter sp.]|uniref:hypothetical protein n=1 Tax=Xanthobacter sp. TaxID=35809 RepID=UPI0025E06033|nr:hypothetical protein [Xanthobacter sp.]
MPYTPTSCLQPPGSHPTKVGQPLTGDRRRGHPGSTAQDLAALCEKLASMGAATEENLLRYGYTPEQLKTLMPEARKILGPARGAFHG